MSVSFKSIPLVKGSDGTNQAWEKLHLSRAVSAAAAKSLQSCLTLCDPIDGSPPGSPVPGILQARTLEWVVIFNQHVIVYRSVFISSFFKTTLIILDISAFL